MSCHGCAREFTLIRTENGCPNCGFSYCSKCLRWKISVPKLGNSVCKVCISCYSTLTEIDKDASSSKAEYCPPESFLKRLESLENPSRPPITLYQKDKRMEQLKVGLNEVDLEIVDRLEKLRDGRKQQPVPTEEEIAKRLAVLKGEDPSRMGSLMGNRKNCVPSDTRTSQEKSDSLVQQLLEEHELNLKQPDAAEETAQRLAKLQGLDTSSGLISAHEKPSSENIIVDTEESLDSMPVDDVNALIVQIEKEMKDGIHQMKELNKDTKHCLKPSEIHLSTQTPAEDSENSEVEKAIQKVLDEVALEEKLDDDSEDSDKEEELPWCIICNENATLRCIDCDNDLYCKSCYTQGHEEWQLQYHRNVPFTPK